MEAKANVEKERQDEQKAKEIKAVAEKKKETALANLVAEKSGTLKYAHKGKVLEEAILQNQHMRTLELSQQSDENLLKRDREGRKMLEATEKNMEQKLKNYTRALETWKITVSELLVARKKLKEDGLWEDLDTEEQACYKLPSRPNAPM